MAAILNVGHADIVGHYYNSIIPRISKHACTYKNMFLAWCSVKMNTFCNLSGSRQPSWIFVVPTSCPRMAHCHLTNLSSGTHNLYDSAKNRRRPNMSRFPTVEYRVATRLIEPPLSYHVDRLSIIFIIPNVLGATFPVCVTDEVEAKIIFVPKRIFLSNSCAGRFRIAAHTDFIYRSRISWQTNLPMCV